MASSDVIELGSSDDEAEPVPKKKKPTPNAMVHFPKEVRGLAIHPAKPVLPNLQKVLAGGAVTITNVKKGKFTTPINKAKPNGRSAQKFVQVAPIKMPIIRNVSVTNPLAINNLSVNPLSLMKKQSNIRVQPSKLSLPPGITVKRTGISQGSVPNISLVKRKQNLKRKHPQKIITTVELDDEEVPLTSGTSPQWYLRPEEQSHKAEKEEDENKEKQDIAIEKNDNMEVENNKEPDTRNYIEITIEDSPIKPLQVMRGFEVGSELPITIEDSPVKHLKSAKDQPSASESDAERSSVGEPQSKKRLDYPKNENGSGITGAQNLVEIDVDMAPVNSKEKSVDSTGADGVDQMKNHSEISKVDKHNRAHTMLIAKDVNDKKINNPNVVQNSEIGEFHPVYQKFIDLCFELENSDDMAKIVEKKIKTYYRQCPKDYVECEDFTDMVASKIFAIKAAPDKMYLYIKDIVDELNLQRKSAKAVEVSNKENTKAEDDKYLIEEDGEYDTKRRRQIRKLDKTIKKLHRAIQKLEEQEVEFEDEEDSVYLLTERYKERLIRVHAKFCQLTNTKMPSEPRIQIEARPGFPMGPAKKLEKWVNKKVPIGTPLPFPDFHDVLRCVRDANEEDGLGWNEADIMDEARDLFTRCGKKLQRRRQENEWRIAAARISHDVSTLDPADKSDDLKKKLEENKTLAAKKEIELVNKYADKQNRLKLVGEEIGDKEADESPVESEDDDGNDESNSLEDKQKRKERLKRLLHEKTKKASSEKENITVSRTNVDKVESEVLKDEKMECDVVLEETENKKEDSQEVINEVEVINNDSTTVIPEDGPSNEQKKEKKDYSDLYDVDSDVDELHLLQKLYSENEINSSTQESDSDTPIAISDTLESDSDNDNVKIQESDDIISIENSSYSESEITKDECESSRTAEVVKDKTIDALLLENSEVLMLSSKDKVDVEEENILLASSDEDNDVDTHSLAYNIEDRKSSKDGSANNDCEVILDNCDENSLENEFEMYEVPLIEGEIGKINKNVTPNTTENDISNANQDCCQLNEISQRKTQFENDVAVDEARNSLVSIEDNQCNLKVLGNKSKEDVIHEVCHNKTNDTTGKIERDNDTIKNKVNNNKCKENCDENILLDNISCTDKVELNILAGNKLDSKHHKDIFKETELCPKSDIKDFNEEIASNSSKTDCTKKEFSECEVMDVNVEIAGVSTLTSQQSTCEDVEVTSSAQCT